MSKQIDAMRKLGLTDAEIAEVLEADKRIDKGEKLFELTAKQEKASKQARKVDREVGVQKRQSKERKVDEVKKDIVRTMVEALIAEKLVDDNTLATANAEREFTFAHDGKKYKVILSCPRS